MLRTNQLNLSTLQLFNFCNEVVEALTLPLVRRECSLDIDCRKAAGLCQAPVYLNSVLEIKHRYNNCRADRLGVHLRERIRRRAERFALAGRNDRAVGVPCFDHRAIGH